MIPGYYDVRGVWGKEVTPETGERIGTALEVEEVAIGHDVRFSSPVLAYHIARGVKNVRWLGVITTPLAYFHAWKGGMETLMVTASHNPPEYTGVKFVHAGGTDWSREEVSELIRRAGTLEPVVQETGFSSSWEWLKEYREFYEGREVRDKITVDFSNGSGYVILPIMERVFERVAAVNVLPDGRFPSHPPDPLEEESWQDIRRYKGWGVVLDGDADRVVVFRDGERVPADVIVSVLSKSVRRVVLEVIMPLKLEEFLRDQGVKVYRSPTGRVLCKEVARLRNADLFAEYSGHFGFREFNYIDDPLFLLSELLPQWEETSYRPPLIKLYRTKGIDVDALLSLLDPDEVVKVDGYDLRTEWGRVVVRQSRTERGVWRVLLESETLEGMKKLEALLSKVLRRTRGDSNPRPSA